MIVDVQISPGVVKDDTELASEGRWVDADKVRFRLGRPELIGGHEKATAQPLLGKGRAIHNWEDLDNLKLTAIGTNRKLYIMTNARLWDITPIRATGSLTDKLATTTGSSKVTISHAGHGLTDGAIAYLKTTAAIGGLNVGGTLNLGANPIFTMEGRDRVIVTLASHGLATGDFVTMASVATVNGVSGSQFTTGHRVLVIDQNRFVLQVSAKATATGAGGGSSGTCARQHGYTVTVVDSDSYTVDAGSAATGTVAAGGGTISYQYEINPGREYSALNAGYGTGPYGEGGYSLSSTDTELRARVWHLSNYGSDLVGTHGDGKIYRWTGDVGTPAKVLAATDAPGQNISLMVTPERFLVALGTEDAASSTFNRMRVAWAQQEGGFSNKDWTPTAQNTAGDFLLSEGSRIVRGVPMALVSLIWTDTALYSLQYLQDTNFIFRPELLGTECGLIGPNAMVRSGDSGRVFWLSSSRRFFVWAGGAPQVLQSPVKDFLFDNMRPLQEDLIFAGTNSEFNEVWWFYPTKDALDCAAYVIYNYAENHWSVGTFDITAWSDRGSEAFPVACHHEDNSVRFHEKGTSDEGGPFRGHVESGYVDLGDGDKLYQVRGFLPDFKNLVGGVDVSMTGRVYPHGNDVSIDLGTVSPTTRRLDGRITARQIKFRFSSNSAPTSWRAGALRFDTKPTQQSR